MHCCYCLFLFRSSTNSVTRWLWRAWMPSEHSKVKKGKNKQSNLFFFLRLTCHLITDSSFSLSCECLWWEQETKVQPFAVKYCVNKTKRDCYSFFFCQCPASETVKWSCTVLFLFSYAPWMLPINVKNNGSFYMPAGNNQIDFPWALYRFKEKKIQTKLTRICRETWGWIFLLFWWFLVIFTLPAFSHTYATRLQTRIKICQRLDILSNIAVLSFLLVFVLSKNRSCHFGFGFLM